MRKGKTLSSIITSFYSAEDFQEWVSELADPDTEKTARERICEGFAALKISFNKQGDNDYFKSHIAYHISKSKRIKSSKELEEDFLNALFQRWCSAEGQQMHRDIQVRRSDAKYSLKEYYECFHIYFVDDIGRNAGFDTKYNFWFDDKQVRKEILEKLPLCDDLEARNFTECMYTLNHLLENGVVQKQYEYSREPSRTYILYLIAVSMISEDRMYGRKNHKSVCQCFRSMYFYSEILTAGYPDINLDNCLDAYVIYSAYKYMMGYLPKRKQYRIK